MIYFSNSLFNSFKTIFSKTHRRKETELKHLVWVYVDLRAVDLLDLMNSLVVGQHRHLYDVQNDVLVSMLSKFLQAAPRLHRGLDMYRLQ